jgi:hypothetical protein
MTVTVDALVTPDDVAGYLNDPTLATNTEIGGFISAASRVIQFHPDHGTGPIIATDYTEYHDGGWYDIVLDHYPVLTISSVKEAYGPVIWDLVEEPLDQTTRNAYGYTADYATGRIIRRSSGVAVMFPTGLQNIIVTYTAGLTTVEGDVRMATLELIRHMWQTQQGGSNVRGVDVQPAGYILPNRVIELLAGNRHGPGVA